MAERTRSATFGPTVVIGPASAVLAAVAASRDWATASGSAAGVHVTGSVKGSTTAPLAVALALVALAAWGVVLVLRGRVRRAVAIVGALACGGDHGRRPHCARTVSGTTQQPRWPPRAARGRRCPRR